MLTIILLAFAFVCFVVAAFWQPATAPPWRPHLGWVGLAFWVLADLLGRTSLGR